MKKVFLFCIAMLVLNIVSSCSKEEEMYITVPEGEVNYLGSNIDFGSDGGTRSFAFTTNRNWTIEVSETRSGENWLSVSATSGGAGEHHISLTADKNTGYDDRSVIVCLIVGDSINRIRVNQKQLDALTLTSDCFELPVEGGSFEVEVRANVDYAIEIPEDCNWIHLHETTKTKALAASSLMFEVDASQENTKREGCIFIISGSQKETIHVFQSGSQILTLSKDEILLGSKAQTISVYVNSNFEFETEMPATDWITEQKTRAVSSHTLNLSIAENTGYESREAIIRFYDKNSSKEASVRIIQSAAAFLEITSEKECLVFEDGAEVMVVFKSSNPVTIKTGASWIKKVDTRAVTESTINFKITAHENIQKARRSYIAITDTINGLTDTIKVVQDRSILFENPSMEIMADNTAQISYTQSIPGRLHWTTSDPTIASVDQNGVVTALAKGTTTITATAEDGVHSCKCEVTVKDITDFVIAYCSGGGVMITNDLVRYGSTLNFVFRNNSEENVTLKSMQLIDGKTGAMGNPMSIDKNVAPNQSVSYSITVGIMGIYLPVTNRMTFIYKNKEYYIDAVYN